jgi:hypothetical protein
MYIGDAVAWNRCCSYPLLLDLEKCLAEEADPPE